MKNEERKRNVRSAKYQAVFAETRVPTELMESFQNGDSIEARLNPWAYDEELLELEDQLKKEFWRVVDECLTERQREIFKMTSDGYTQMEIAKKLGISQATCAKALIGSQKYCRNEAREIQSSFFYGGSFKKLRQFIFEDKRVAAILERMKEIREEKI